LITIMQPDCVEPRVARGNFGGKTQFWPNGRNLWLVFLLKYPVLDCWIYSQSGSWNSKDPSPQLLLNLWTPAKL
jgi:hypothetical protein